MAIWLVVSLSDKGWDLCPLFRAARLKVLFPSRMKYEISNVLWYPENFRLVRGFFSIMCQSQLKCEGQTNLVFVLTSSTLFTANMFGWTSLISNLVATHPMLLFWCLHALGSLYHFLFMRFSNILFFKIGFFICSLLWNQYEAEMLLQICQFFICLDVRDGCDGDGQLLSQLEVILFSENQGREQSASALTTPVKVLL